MNERKDPLDTPTADSGPVPESRATPEPSTAPPRPFFQRAMLYPDIYVWYIFFASLDIMLTWVVLHFGGSEVNPLADWVLQRGGLRGMVAFKFGLVLFVIAICEIVGQRNSRAGRRLAQWAVVITAFPVAWALWLLLRDVYSWVLS